MKNFKKLIIIVLTVALLTGLVSCTSAPKASGGGDRPTIMYIAAIIGHPVYARIEAALIEASNDYGFDVVSTGAPNVEFDKMIECVERGIAEGVDGVISCGSPESSYIPVFTKAKDRGIKTALFFIDLPDQSLRTTAVISNSEQIGYDIAKALHEQLGGADLKLGCISGSIDAVDERIQRDGVQRYMDEHPGSEIITVVTDNWELVKTEEAFHNLLQGYSEVNAVFATHGAQAPALAKALASLGLDTKSMPVITMDDVDENMDALREGRLFGLMAQDFYAMGYTNGENIYKAINGETVPNLIEAPGFLITLSNIDTYMDDWAKTR